MIDFQKEENEFKNIISWFGEELKKIRTGRASALILEGIMVDTYSAKTPLAHAAAISAPDPKSVVVRPWDKNLLPAIEQALAKAEPKEIAAIIRPVNFFQNKTKNIIGCAKALVEKYSGKPPHDLNKLIELPGVGRKTANVFLSEFGHDAIGVDTHVAYISQRIGWTKHSNPHKIEKDLEKLFPQKYWSRVNGACVRFGKTYQSRKTKGELLKKISKI